MKIPAGLLWMLDNEVLLFGVLGTDYARNKKVLSGIRNTKELLITIRKS